VIKEYFEKSETYRLGLPEGTTLKKALERLSKLPEVEFVEPNYTIELKGR
jgi:hypothetical protein